MGKDGAGGIGGLDDLQSTKRKGSVMATTIYDVHIVALNTLDRELERLHNDICNGDGDDDVTQSQVSAIIKEIARLSEALSDAEIANERS